MARRFLPLLFSQTSLRVGIKVLSVRGVVGLSANGKIRGEILPEDLLCYLFTFSLTSPLCLMYLNTVYLCVCLWRGHAFCCLPNFLCKEGGKSNHLQMTATPPCDQTRESVFSSLVIVQPPPKRPISLLSASPHPNETQCLMCRLPLSPCGRWSWSLFPLLTEALAARIQQAARCFPPSLL